MTNRRAGLLIARQVRRQRSKPPERLFAGLESPAFAAASLGHIHRGRLKDAIEGALKLQRPSATPSAGTCTISSFLCSRWNCWNWRFNETLLFTVPLPLLGLTEVQPGEIGGDWLGSR